MHVDESGRDDQAAGIDFASGLAGRHPAHGNDALAANGDVAVKPGIAGAVDDPPMADDQVVARLLRLRG